MEDFKDQMKEARIKDNLSRRKHQVNQKIWNSRLSNSSNQNQLQQVEEDKEVHTEKPMKGTCHYTSTRIVTTIGEDAKEKSAGSANREAT